MSTAVAKARYVVPGRPGDRRRSNRIVTHILAFEGEPKVTFFDGNFTEYEERRKQPLGDAATRPHRITYRKPTR